MSTLHTAVSERSVDRLKSLTMMCYMRTLGSPIVQAMRRSFACLAIGLALSSTASAIGSCAGEDGTTRTPNVGAKALAMLEPMPDAPLGEQDLPYAGKATFSETAEGVDLYLEFDGCQSYKRYPLRIVNAADCASLASSSVWESDRGLGISDGGCWGPGGRAKLYYSRPSDGPYWSVGDGSNSDVVGRSVVLYHPEAPDRPLACGAITRVPGTPPDPATLPPLPVARAEVEAQLAGICLGRNMSSMWDDTCPNAENLAQCAKTHCELEPCLRHCSNYVSCLEASPDNCTAACFPDGGECGKCMGDVLLCAVNGFCAEQLHCAKPTPGGPCSELEACCMRQGERAQVCLKLARQLAAQGGGDNACISFAQDEDFLTNLIYDPVCTFSFVPPKTEP